MAAVAELEQKGLIRKRQGDHNQPNELGLKSGIPFGSPDYFESDPEDPNRSQGLGPNGSHNKDRVITREKNSLSSDSKILREYFENLRPRKKRDEEFQKFEILKVEFAEAEIELALGYVQKHGALGTSEPCHSPMAYLARAMTEVIAKARENEARLERVASEQRALSAQAQREREQERFEDLERQKREQEFEKAFASEQERRRYLESFSSKHPGFRVDSPILKQLAILDWWQGQNSKGVSV